ncbi:MAG: hypothetical protein H3Z50_01950 [archaeon]|nr:hypothetical protein [archaeon]MCP8306914.1 hypothetical protein [archaeon]
MVRSRDDMWFKAGIAQLILMKQPERALELLSKLYQIEVPKLTVGLVKGRSKAAAVYVSRRKMIYASHRDGLFNPAVILHEFYHHLRTRSGKHRGTEKHADLFAWEY